MARQFFPACRNVFFTVALAAAALVGILQHAKADWENYRGPSHNGVSSEKLPATFPKEGLKQLWSAKVGTGTSSITVSGDHVYTMGNSNGSDTVWCFEAKTGKVLWKHEYPLSLEARNFEGGTAATPTVDGNRVYSVSHEGDPYDDLAFAVRLVWRACRRQRTDQEFRRLSG